MAGYLKVSPEKLQATAAGFQEKGSRVNNLTQQMVSIVTSLSGQVWSGEAAMDYLNDHEGVTAEEVR